MIQHFCFESLRFIFFFGIVLVVGLVGTPIYLCLWQNWLRQVFLDIFARLGEKSDIFWRNYGWWWELGLSVWCRLKMAKSLVKSPKCLRLKEAQRSKSCGSASSVSEELSICSKTVSWALCVCHCICKKKYHFFSWNSGFCIITVCLPTQNSL